jgi:methylmalonyl-CoA/ethylmalonyl-CoA epimerase
MKIKRIEHIAVAVDDLEGGKSMLTDLFGLNLEYEERINTTTLAMYPVGQTYLELLHSEDPTSRTRKWIGERGVGLFHICFEVEDISEALAELKAKGVKLLNDQPVSGHNGSKIAFIDPESTGNMLIELAELAAHPAAQT